MSSLLHWVPESACLPKHHLCVALTILDILVGRIDRFRIVRSRISDYRIDNALNIVKFSLRAPKSPSGNLQNIAGIFWSRQKGTNVGSLLSGRRQRRGRGSSCGNAVIRCHHKHGNGPSCQYAKDRQLHGRQAQAFHHPQTLWIPVPVCQQSE